MFQAIAAFLSKAGAVEAASGAAGAKSAGAAGGKGGFFSRFMDAYSSAGGSDAASGGSGGKKKTQLSAPDMSQPTNHQAPDAGSILANLQKMQ